MILFPNAKINIGLNVVKKRKDEFHDIETIFYPVQWYDILEFKESKFFEFNVSGISVGGNAEDNLVVKAFRLMQKQFQLPELSVHLHKTIPFGAGLGGGSADASFMIKGINTHFNLNLSDEKLENIAGSLGSDCPFFIKNKPVYAHGKGNIFSEIQVNLSKYYFIIVKPPIFISTPEAFAGINVKQPKVNLKSLYQKPIEDWKNTIFNDFETSLFPKHSVLEKIKYTLYIEGAIFASMSGSGSALFGIFDKNPTITNSIFKNLKYKIIAPSKVL